MPVKIKICGITRYEDARVAAGLGVDAVGFIFSEKSPRYIEPVKAGEIIRKLPPFINKVGVFVDVQPSVIIQTAEISGIDTVQLHGHEPPEVARRLPFTVIKAFPVKPGWDLSVLDDYNVSAVLLDAWDSTRAGGTGRTFDWSVAREAVNRNKCVILAGGLAPVNIREALDSVGPYAVDLNSGVEIKPGVKNLYKMKEAVSIIRAWK
jgi:phosphoribosylanthranilate isomerase